MQVEKIEKSQILSHVWKLTYLEPCQRILLWIRGYIQNCIVVDFLACIIGTATHFKKCCSIWLYKFRKIPKCTFYGRKGRSSKCKPSLDRAFVAISINKWNIINHFCSFYFAFKLVLSSFSPCYQSESVQSLSVRLTMSERPHILV